jgi:hypothetical protein
MQDHRQHDCEEQQRHEGAERQRKEMCAKIQDESFGDNGGTVRAPSKRRNGKCISSATNSSNYSPRSPVDTHRDTALVRLTRAPRGTNCKYRRGSYLRRTGAGTALALCAASDALTSPAL